MVIMNISLPSEDKHCFFHKLYDPGNPIWLYIQENPVTITLILLVFTVWHAVTYVCVSQDKESIPGIGQYVCGNNISSIEVTKFWGDAPDCVTGK